jgi:hypothetical protein
MGTPLKLVSREASKGFGTMPGKVVPRVPLRHESSKDHLTSFGGLAALSLDALSSVAYGPDDEPAAFTRSPTPG